ncbi:condensation domain-containing protein [Amycolatopsis sp. NPDC004079]|uniref:condensation domain-containing protein n=1 Tax=Amycolatopsis sp. NPDC004079 TaxID=3154549 RepID=UPI0033B3F0F6
MTEHLAPGPVETPASAGQRLLWMMRHYRSELGALSCPVLCRVRGSLEVARLERALNALADRHEALRTTFAGRGPRLLQRVHESMPVTARLADFSSAEDPEQPAWQAVRQELSDPIDVTRCSFRALVLRLSTTDHLVCFTMHHLVSDAWSCGVLFRELCALYSGEDLPDVQWQYRDFVSWQWELRASGGLRRQEDYWLRQLAGAELPRLPRLAGDAARPVAIAAGQLGPSVAGRLDELAVRERTTPFAVLLAVFYARLHVLTGQRDLVVASLFANRLRPETRATVGFLANMVLLRTVVAPRATFADLLRATHRTATGALLNQELPYQMLPLRTPESDGARADDLVFQVMPEMEYRIRCGEAECELLVPDDIGNRFRLEFTVTPVGDGYRLVLFYSKDILDEVGARELVAGFLRVATAVAAAPDVPLEEIAG